MLQMQAKARNIWASEGEAKEQGPVARAQRHLFPLCWGLSCWKRAALKGPVVISFRVEEVPRSVSEITSSQEGS